jgi:hypothetical protein
MGSLATGGLLLLLLAREKERERERESERERERYAAGRELAARARHVPPTPYTCSSKSSTERVAEKKAARRRITNGSHNILQSFATVVMPSHLPFLNHKTT